MMLKFFLRATNCSTITEDEKELVLTCFLFHFEVVVSTIMCIDEKEVQMILNYTCVPLACYTIA